MLTEYIQAGEIDEQGNLQVDRPIFARGMRSMKRRMKVEVIVREWKPRRSNAANRYYWGVVLQLIAEDVGDDKESLHRFFKLKFLRPREIQIMGETFSVEPSTSELDAQQFHDYVKHVRLFALQERGIETPDPDPEWFAHREKKRRAA